MKAGKRGGITDEQLEEWRLICVQARSDCKTYQCPICMEWVVYPESHYHKVGEAA